MQEQLREENFQREMMREQQAGDPNTIYADAMREDKIKNIIGQLNPESLLTEVEHRIRGEKKNPFTNDWEIISGEQMVSEELVQKFISFLNAYLTQNTSLSNFSAQEINSIMQVVIEYIRDELSDNSIYYGLTKRETITRKVKVKVLQPYINEEGLSVVGYKEVEIEQEVQVGDEVTDYNKLNHIGHIVCQSVYSVLKQAQNGMLSSRIFKALRVTENVNGGGKSKADFLKFWN